MRRRFRFGRSIVERTKVQLEDEHRFYTGHPGGESWFGSTAQRHP